MNVFPWVLFSIIGGIVVWRRLLPDINYAALSLTLGYPICLFILLSSFKTRMPYYMMQLLPFLALLAATAFVKFTQVSRHRFPHWYRLVTLLSNVFSGLGILLAIAGIIITIVGDRPIGGIFIPPAARIFAVPAIILGCGWASIPILWKRWQPSTTPYWLAAWLVPVWLTFVAIGWQGSWTDRTPEFTAAFHQPQIRQALASSPRQSVNILSNTVESDGFKASSTQHHFLTSEQHKTLVLLSFYTPRLGKQVQSFTDLPDRSYAWALSIPPQLATQSRIVGTVQGWKLIQKISR